MNIINQLSFFRELSSSRTLNSSIPPNPIKDSRGSVFEPPEFVSYVILTEDTGLPILTETTLSAIVLEESGP
jgi:hypothetical protein